MTNASAMCQLHINHGSPHGENGSWPSSHAQLIADFPINAQLIPTSRFLFALEDSTSSHACLIYDEESTIIHELFFVGREAPWPRGRAGRSAR